MRERPQTYAVTIVCAERVRVYQRAANAELMIATLFRYRDQGRYRLHAFAVMPDHMHAVISPAASVEQTVGLIKGGYSFAVREQYRGPVWQDGYYVHRVVDGRDYDGQVRYIAANPERRGYEGYRYVHTEFLEQMDPKPEHLGG